MLQPKVAGGVLIVSCMLAAGPAKTKERRDPSFVPATVVSSVAPIYPETAVRPGTVVLDVSLDASGEMQGVKIASGAEAFNAPALAAIKGWKFEPATLDGKPVASVVPVAFSFSWPVACVAGGHR